MLPIFKTDRISKEWEELKTLNPRLRNILGQLTDYVDHEFKKQVVITCIYRSPEENAELYKDSVEPAWRPHTLHCGADLRSSIYTPAEITKMLSFLNHFTVWKGQRKCAAFHAITGNVLHFHVQVDK
jgi:hypothetical protein